MNEPLSNMTSLVSFFPIDEDLHHILDQNATTQTDFFENVYSDPMVNGCMIAVYIFGFLGCAGLILVLWFERSGLAGPYRSVVNQLVSQNIVQVH